MARPPRKQESSSPTFKGKPKPPARRGASGKPASPSGTDRRTKPSAPAGRGQTARPSKPASRPKPPAVKKDPDSDQLRLHVAIAHSGLCSRRAAEEMIRAGRVQVNGEIVSGMGMKVGPEDQVLVDGQPIVAAKHYTVLLNKPTGVVTTLSDPQRRPTIVNHLPDLGVQLKPVGRLDMDTEGLLLCTNDGELAQRLAHPRYGIEKEYHAIVAGIPEDKALKALREGVFVEGRRTAPAQVTVVHAEPRRNTTSLKIVIHEGRKRQIRIMCETVGHPVQALKRVRIGPLYLKGMRPGEAKMLGKKEVDELRALVGLPPS